MEQRLDKDVDPILAMVWRTEQEVRALIPSLTSAQQQRLTERLRAAMAETVPGGADPSHRGG